MPGIKERLKSKKSRAKIQNAIRPKQARQILKEEYVPQLGQRSPRDGTGSEYAIDQVEESGHWAVDELTAAALRRHVEGPEHKVTPPTDATLTRNLSAKMPKARGAVVHPSANATKECAAIVCHTEAERPPAHTTLNNIQCGSAVPYVPTMSTTPQAEQMPIHISNTPPVETSAGGVAMPGRRPAMVKERPRASAATIKTRANIRGVAKASADPPAPKVRPQTPQAVAKQATRKARQTAQQHMKRQMVAKAQKAAKTAAVAVKRVAVAIVKAAAALVSSFVGLLGGGFLLIALVVVVIIAAVANSPFGLFFATEKNAPDTVSVAQAVAQVNMDYNAKLEALQAGSYDSIAIHGQGPGWPDVLAVFAVKTAGADSEGMGHLQPGHQRHHQQPKRGVLP